MDRFLTKYKYQYQIVAKSPSADANADADTLLTQWLGWCCVRADGTNWLLF